jgi:hypothetical protein
MHFAQPRSSTGFVACSRCGLFAAAGASRCRCGAAFNSDAEAKRKSRQQWLRRFNTLAALALVLIWLGLLLMFITGKVEKRPSFDLLVAAGGFWAGRLGSGRLDRWLRKLENQWLRPERERLLQVGTRAVGVVSEVTGDDVWMVTYTFKPRGREESIERTEEYGDLAKPPVVGQAVDVVYDPRSPQYSMIVGWNAIDEERLVGSAPS